MEAFQLLRDDSIKRIKIADHMLNVTYPLIKDPKILIAVTENIFLSLSYALGSLLHYERLFKKIPDFKDNFKSKFEIFKNSCIKRYSLSEGYLKLLQDVKNIIMEHRKSPVEFKRNDSLVICNDHYRCRTLDECLLKKYLADSKLFLNEISLIVSKDERIFK